MVYDVGHSTYDTWRTMLAHNVDRSLLLQGTKLLQGNRYRYVCGNTMPIAPSYYQEDGHTACVREDWSCTPVAQVRRALFAAVMMLSSSLGSLASNSVIPQSCTSPRLSDIKSTVPPPLRMSRQEIPASSTY